MDLTDLKDPRKPSCVFLWPSVCWFPGLWNTCWGLRAHLVSLSSPWSHPQRRYFQVRPHLRAQGPILYFPLSSRVLLWAARGNQTAASTMFGNLSWSPRSSLRSSTLEQWTQFGRGLWLLGTGPLSPTSRPPAVPSDCGGTWGSETAQAASSVPRPHPETLDVHVSVNDLFKLLWAY